MDAGTNGVIIDCGFPGGNIIPGKIEGDDVFIRQDLRDTAGDWFYWYFRVRGAGGRVLTFHFPEDLIGARGPGVSVDGGRTWSWLGLDAVEGVSFKYRFRAGDGEVRFSFGMPYLEAGLHSFLRERSGSPSLRVEKLTVSRKGRTVEKVHLGRLDGRCRHRVLLTCRHHCCEMMASYALEGIMASVLDGSDEEAWFRENVEFMAVPFVDKDGVEDGDQGKNRTPHDHGRDYGTECIYPEVRAIRDLVPAWSDGRLRFAMDMHCPWVKGEGEEHAFFVGIEDRADWEKLGRFSKLLEEVREGPIPYDPSDNLPFGARWNTGRDRGRLDDFHGWAAGLPGIILACSLELPYANARAAEVTADSARAFGRDLARAIRRFLE